VVRYTDHMKVIAATEFKSHCLQILEDVKRTGESITVTKRGVPFAEINPVQRSPLDYSAGHSAHTGKVVGDLVAPLDDIVWEALQS
jgi:prevent-host-death family protein